MGDEDLDLMTWNKMRIEPQVDSDKTVRINVSLNDSCIEAIDEFKNKWGLFNGRSDYIIAAIRFYYFKTIIEADSILSGETRRLVLAEKIDGLKEKVSKLVDTDVDLCKTMYKAKHKQQISIYVSEIMRDCLGDLESLSGKRVGTIIQAAIATYHLDLYEKLRLRNKLIGLLNYYYRGSIGGNYV